MQIYSDEKFVNDIFLVDLLELVICFVFVVFQKNCKKSQIDFVELKVQKDKIKL